MIDFAWAHFNMNLDDSSESEARNLIFFNLFDPVMISVNYFDLLGCIFL